MNKGQSWNLCHAVNIYVYRNGISNNLPVLVHIPSEKKKNMQLALEAIQDRMKLTVGFPEKLYYTNGIRVCRTTELQMYEEYVVVSSTDMRFKCADYGRPRTPLVAIGRYSKHIKSINVNERNYNIFNLRQRKKYDNKWKYAFASNFVSDGIGPGELPFLGGNVECGALCQNMKRFGGGRCSKPDKCLSKPPPCQRPPTSNDMSEISKHLYVVDDQEFYDKYQKECEEMACADQQREDIAVCTSPKTTTTSVNSEHLLAFINRYRDIGGQLYRMFYERLNEEDDSPSKNNLAVNTDQAEWFGEHLFQKFIDRMETKTHSGSGSKGTTDKRSVASPSPLSGTPGRNVSTRKVDLNEMSDSRTGARGAGTSSQSNNVNKSSYGSPSTNRSQSPTGTRSPKNQKNMQVYHTTLQNDNLPPFDIHSLFEKLKFNKESNILKIQPSPSLDSLSSEIHQDDNNNFNINVYSSNDENEHRHSHREVFSESPESVSDDDDGILQHMERSFQSRRNNFNRSGRNISPIPISHDISDLNRTNIIQHQSQNIQQRSVQRQIRNNLQNDPRSMANSTRPIRGRPQRPPPLENHANLDNFRIVHHHRLPVRSERHNRHQNHNPPPETPTQRLLIPTYDSNGNFMHYVFQ